MGTSVQMLTLVLFDIPTPESHFCPITSWEDNARVLGVSVGSVCGDCIRKYTTTNPEPAMFVILCFVV